MNDGTERKRNGNEQMVFGIGCAFKNNVQIFQTAVVSRGAGPALLVGAVQPSRFRTFCSAATSSRSCGLPARRFMEMRASIDATKNVRASTVTLTARCLSSSNASLSPTSRPTSVLPSAVRKFRASMLFFPSPATDLLDVANSPDRLRNAGACPERPEQIDRGLPGIRRQTGHDVEIERHARTAVQDAATPPAITNST